MVRFLAATKPFVAIRSRGRALHLAPLPLALAVAGVTLCVDDAQARITKVLITTKESPTFGGYSWPGVGQYEKLYGKAFGEVDPLDPKNAVIVDIASRREMRSGKVEYSFDFYILKPIDLKKGAHKVMYEPPNRGGKTWNSFGRVTSGPGGANDPGSIVDPAVLAELVPDAARLHDGLERMGQIGQSLTPQPNFNTTITLPVAKKAWRRDDHRACVRYIVTGGATLPSAMRRRRWTCRWPS